MRKRIKAKQWVIIIVGAIAFHLALLILVQPSFFSVFKKTITSSTPDGEAESFAPMAIVTIPIEIEDRSSELEQNPVQNRAQEPTTVAKKTENVTQLVSDETLPAESGEPANERVDIEKLVGESPETLPHTVGPEAVAIPPRALEITWPDTRQLKHCLGHSIDIKIRVNHDGSIAHAEALTTDHPADCVRAAVESAKRIIFEPGLVNGQPAAMWTQVRIDFRKKK